MFDIRIEYEVYSIKNAGWVRMMPHFQQVTRKELAEILGKLEVTEYDIYFHDFHRSTAIEIYVG